MNLLVNKMFVGSYFVLMAVCSLQLINARVAKISNDTKILFPGPISMEKLTNKYGNANKTHPCEGLTFCTVKPDDYPEELFNKLFKGKFKEPIFQPTLSSLGDRLSDLDDNDTDDCERSVTFEPLYQVRQLDGNWLTVVQAPKENFVQLVRLETCTEADSKCFNEFEPPIELKSFCKQKYNQWEFLVHDGKDGMKKENLVLPTCCVCQYKNKYFT